MSAINGAVGCGAEVRVYRVPEKTDGAPYAAQLTVKGQEMVTCYGEDAEEAMDSLEEYLGQSAVTSLARRMEEATSSKREDEPKPLDIRSLRIEVEGVRDADKDIRTREVWVKYGVEGARHELRMPYKDAVLLRSRLMAMSFPPLKE